MPELPEVETFAADLRPLVVGRTITAVDVRFPKMVRHPEAEAFSRDLPGRRVVALERRGKYLVFRLEGPTGASRHLPASGEARLVVHLGMTGQFLHKLPEDPERPHTHVVLSLDNGTQLRYSDPRQFGRLLLGTEEELVAARAMPRLGPEPLDPSFTPRELHRRLSRRRAPLKLLLLDQSV